LAFARPHPGKIDLLTLHATLVGGQFASQGMYAAVTNFGIGLKRTFIENDNFLEIISLAGFCAPVLVIGHSLSPFQCIVLGWKIDFAEFSTNHSHLLFVYFKSS
jgi:hypothetical protein